MLYKSRCILKFVFLYAGCFVNEDFNFPSSLSPRFQVYFGWYQTLLSRCCVKTFLRSTHKTLFTFSKQVFACYRTMKWKVLMTKHASTCHHHADMQNEHIRPLLHCTTSSCKDKIPRPDNLPMYIGVLNRRYSTTKRPYYWCLTLIQR